MQLPKIILFLVALLATVVLAQTAPTRFLDSERKRALNPFLDSIGKRARLHKRYFDSLAGQSLGKRSGLAFENLY